MALPLYRTMGELRLELAMSLGHEADPDAANQDRMRGLLDRAQQDLWQEITAWTRGVVDFTIQTARGVWRYEWPDGCDPDRVQYVYLRWDVNQVHQLREGFGVAEYDLRREYTSWPTRYRRRDQLEVFPTPDDDSYEIIVGAQVELPSMRGEDGRYDDALRFTVPDDMVLKQAIVYGFEGQGRGVPMATQAALQRRVGQLRARSHSGPYLPHGPGGGSRPGASWPRPVTLGPPTYRT